MIELRENQGAELGRLRKSLEKATSDANPTVRTLNNKIKEVKAQLTMLTSTVVKLAVLEGKTAEDEEFADYLDEKESAVETAIENAQRVIDDKEDVVVYDQAYIKQFKNKAYGIKQDMLDTIRLVKESQNESSKFDSTDLPHVKDYLDSVVSQT